MLTRKKKAEIKKGINDTLFQMTKIKLVPEKDKMMSDALISPDKGNIRLFIPELLYNVNNNKSLSSIIIKENENNYYILIDELVKYAYDFEAHIMEDDDKRYIKYSISFLFGTGPGEILGEFSYRETDMYPSLSKYISEKTLEYIYKNACKGE